MATLERSVEQVTGALRFWAGEHRVGSAVEEPRPDSPGGEVDVFLPEAGWVVAMWRRPRRTYRAGWPCPPPWQRPSSSPTSTTATWAGRPAVVADALGVTADIVAPYYAQPTEVVLGAIRGGERFSVDDPWVFVDLWSRLGIPYPVSSPPAVRVRFDPGWEAKLPYERSDF